MKVELEVKEGVMLSIEDYNRLQAGLSAERTRRESAERITDLLIEICDHSPPVLLMHRISALAGEAKAYRTQYPRVGEET